MILVTHSLLYRCTKTYSSPSIEHICCFLFFFFFWSEHPCKKALVDIHEICGCEIAEARNINIIGALFQSQIFSGLLFNFFRFFLVMSPHRTWASPVESFPFWKSYHVQSPYTWLVPVMYEAEGTSYWTGFQFWCMLSLFNQCALAKSNNITNFPHSQSLTYTHVNSKAVWKLSRMC